MNTLADRLKLVLGTYTSPNRRFAELQELSGNTISADSWKNVWHGRQRPTVEMIELAARTWPEHVLWLTTGAVHPETGHEEPGGQGIDWMVDLNVGEHIYAKRALRHRVQMCKVIDSFLAENGEDSLTHVEAVRLLMSKEPSLWQSAGTLEQMALSERQLLNEQLLHGNKKKR